MKKSRITLLFLFVVLVALILGANSASARAERFEFEAVQTFVFPPPPPLPDYRTWDSDGIRHVRNLYLVFSISGDVNGTNHLLINSNTHIDTGDGVMWSTIVLDLEWMGMSGTFEGKSQNSVIGGSVLNQGRTHYVGKGTGDFEGMTMFAEYGFDPNVSANVLRGTILVYNGD
jgi:hypothetical protein